MTTRTTIRAGVIGYGYWGPNLTRNIAASDSMELAAIADPRPERRHAANKAHPGTPTFQAAEAILADASVELVVVATPPQTHFGLVAAALRAGKHVLVEKPFVTSEADARALITLAASVGRHLLIDHTFLFTGAVRAIRKRLPQAGDVLYYDATRTNLGTFQAGTDVLWDLAPHDLSILLSLVATPVELVSALGAQHGEAGGPTMAHVTLRFEGGLVAHLHLNWLAPVKVRRTIIGGSRRMFVYDDTEASEKLKIYDASGSLPPATSEGVRGRMVDYRVGDVTSPHIDPAEALAREVEHVARVIRGEEEPISDAHLGLRVVRVIEAAQRSAALDGVPGRVQI